MESPGNECLNRIKITHRRIGDDLWMNTCIVHVTSVRLTYLFHNFLVSLHTCATCGAQQPVMFPEDSASFVPVTDGTMYLSRLFPNRSHLQGLIWRDVDSRVSIRSRVVKPKFPLDMYETDYVAAPSVRMKPLVPSAVSPVQTYDPGGLLP